MPTILRVGSYRFFIYAGDRDEPFHIHVESRGNTAKFWLDPIRLQHSRGFNRKDINRLRMIVEDNQELLIGKWNEYFNE